jgi:hypothetical protein
VILVIKSYSDNFDAQKADLFPSTSHIRIAYFLGRPSNALELP